EDRHVLAAAMQAAADYIVTFNVSEFPSHYLYQYGVEAVHPDTFLCRLMDSGFDGFVTAVRNHRASLSRPAKSAREYIETLRRLGLKELAQHLEAHAGSI